MFVSSMSETATNTSSEEEALKLRNAPISEAVLDIDCDMPPNFNLAGLEADARKLFAEPYPQFRAQFLQEAQIEQRPNEPPVMSARQGLQSLQFFKADHLQLVQVRQNGFSFNRLAPYSSLDAYLPEIHRSWELFRELANPLRVRRIALRYINRILLPLTAGRVELDEYLKIGPRLPDEKGLTLGGFLNQHSALETATGNIVNTILTSQPVENSFLPLIFDIEAVRLVQAESNDWDQIDSVVKSLRSLKNRVFRNTLSQQCLKLFQ